MCSIDPCFLCAILSHGTYLGRVPAQVHAGEVTAVRINFVLISNLKISPILSFVLFCFSIPVASEGAYSRRGRGDCQAGLIFLGWDFVFGFSREAIARRPLLRPHQAGARNKTQTPPALRFFSLSCFFLHPPFRTKQGKCLTGAAEGPKRPF